MPAYLNSCIKNFIPRRPFCIHALYLAWPFLCSVEGHKKVLIDPFVPEGSVASTTPDIVAVTHGHHDHLGEAMALKKPVVAIGEIARYLQAQGVPAEGMNLGGTITVGGVSFTMTPAVHSAGIDTAAGSLPGGAAAGYVIRMDGVSVYHAGDTALFSDMKLIGELSHPDIAFLPIGRAGTQWGRGKR